MSTSSAFNHRVIPIDETVKRLITLYIEMFPNQREAAKRIDVSACTINTYNTRSTHIALYVFDKIVKELLKNYAASELNTALGDATVDDLRSRAKRQNGAQIDNVMYIINPQVRKVLDLYIEPFPSREAGGAHLGLNPRTFTAYFKGQISSFPRKYFWEIIKELDGRGMSEDDVLKEIGAKAFDEFLEEKERSRTLQVTKDQLVKEMVVHFRKGSLKEKDFPRSLANAAERLFGNLGAAIRATMKELARQHEVELKKIAATGSIRKSVDMLNLYEHYLMLYRVKEVQVNKALPRNKKQNVDRLMRPYLRMSQELQDVVQELLLNHNISLNKIVPEYDEEQMVNDPDSVEPIRYEVVRRYAFNEKYAIGEVIDHPGLGIGEVTSIKNPTRIVVDFKNKKYGTKELVVGGITYKDFE